ncbi:MAG: uroporphyrinogen-III synthase [Gammaproteobacteria bacterium]|nr:MAG: uroporphyrinogen-III synthase [Gammaproteobacteria bacterium]
MTSLHILVTRPSPAGEALCKLIEARGDHALHLPTIAFVQQTILPLGAQDWIIFTSPQAVYSSPLRLPPHAKFAAVGAGTAAALKAAGYLTTVYPTTNQSSEGLLALPEFQTLPGQKIAIIRGAGGREQLEKILTARGAHVTSVIAYQRILPTIDISSYLPLLKKKQINVIITTSGEGAQNLKRLFQDQGWPEIRQIPLIVVSDRIKLIAEALGFQTVWVARHAGHQAIFEVLEQKRNELCQK